MRSGLVVPRIVLDINVWVSGLIKPDGPPGRLLQAVARGEVTAVASTSMARDIAATLRRPKIRDRYAVSEQDVAEAMALLLLVSIGDPVPHPGLRDSDDEILLVTAVAAQADALVTGDHDILDDAAARDWLADQHVQLLSPAEWLADEQPR